MKYLGHMTIHRKVTVEFDLEEPPSDYKALTIKAIEAAANQGLMKPTTDSVSTDGLWVESAGEKPRLRLVGNE